MIKTDKETIAYVINSFISELGYDAEAYFPENRYDEGYISKFSELADKISAETFEWSIHNRKQLVLIRAGITHQGKNQYNDESFTMSLNFGYVKESEFKELLEHFKSEGNVHKIGFNPEKPFKDTLYVNHDMLSDHNRFLRNCKIDSVLEC